MLMVTSFNQSLYNSYGKRMTEEFSQKSDGSVKLAVIFEGEVLPRSMPLKNVEYIIFNNEAHQGFLKKFGNLFEARGFRVNFLENNQIQIYYDYKFDAVRFSFKVFSLLQAIDVLKPKDFFAWLDADIRCIKSFSSSELSKFFPGEGELMSYLGRNFPQIDPYSECGFLGFNNNHPLTANFLSRVAQVYSSGEIFSHHQWHDSWIWDQVRIEFENKGVKFKSISGAAYETHHPFINCELGKFFDHLKGPQRKEIGQSFPEDYKLSSR
ncbi:hypothetical protein D521_0128 [beta proteobacterium CB]|nr:hypothetical protein D521_0128 [beta proteobacterium CB]